MNNPTYILFDYDILVYRAGFAAQTTEVSEDRQDIGFSTDEKGIININFIPIKSKITIVKPERYAIAACDAIIRSVQKELNIRAYEGFLTGTGNFRLKIEGNKEYKANRKDFVKPVHYDAIRKHLVNSHRATIVEGQEADDELGIQQELSNEYFIGKSVIVSIDKDLTQIPGWHYNLNTHQLTFSEDPGILKLTKDEKGRYHLSGTGFKWFMAQMLLGDTADNIEGIHKMGPKRVFDLLDPIYHAEDLYQEIKLSYKKANKTREQFEGTLNLLWIRRKENQFFTAEGEEIINNIDKQPNRRINL